MLDNRGMRLEVGQLVAFNISGQVARGEITKLSTTIKIRLEHNAAGMPPGHISTLKNSRSVLVLEGQAKGYCADCKDMIPMDYLCPDCRAREDSA